MERTISSLFTGTQYAAIGTETPERTLSFLWCRYSAQPPVLRDGRIQNDSYPIFSSRIA